jgi:CheY-like chemotaxis protein
MSFVLKRKGGFEVHVTENVGEILKIADEGNLSAIIMDVSLSNSEHNGQKVDGIYIAKLLKENPKTAAIPIILATAHSMLGDRERYMEFTKADHYISKPFHDPDEFFRGVASVVSG